MATKFKRPRPAKSPNAAKAEAPRMQVKPFNQLAQLALRELAKNTQQAQNEILVAAMQQDGIDPAQGWQLDTQRMIWFRPAPPENNAPAAAPEGPQLAE